jgi:hypothetical protein
MKGATALLCANTSNKPNNSSTITIGASQLLLLVLQKRPELSQYV